MSGVSSQLSSFNYTTQPLQGINSAVYKTAGTFIFTIPVNVASLRVTVIGGGGAGGGCNTLGGTGGGGGAGGFAQKTFNNLIPGTIITVTVGGAGVGSTLDGTNGGTSSFGSLVSATGGGGGTASTPVVGSSGSGSGGDINYSGFRTFPGQSVSGGAGSCAGLFLGLGGSPGSLGGGSGVGVGSGGGGGTTNTGVSGGNGAPGIVIIEW